MKKRKQPKFKPGDMVYAGSGPSGIYKRRSPERVLLGQVVRVLPRGRVVIEMLLPPKKSSPSPLDTPEDYVMLGRMVTTTDSKHNQATRTR